MDTLLNTSMYQSICTDISKSKKIEKYSKKHSESKRIADLYTVLAHDETKKKSEREIFSKKANDIYNCNKTVEFYYNKETAETLTYSKFCKQRFCPICNYNDELKHFKVFSQIVTDVKVKNCKWLFITLTIRNSEYSKDLELTAETLKTSIDTILNGFRNLTTSERSFLKKHSLGMFRCLEITRNKKDFSFHPHLHLLVCVDESYDPKSKDWIDKAKLQKHWQKVCKLDYLPIVDIEFVDTAEKSNAVAEVSKYQTKSADIVNAETLYILNKVLNHTRVRGYTGIIKELKADIEERMNAEKIDLKEIILDERFVKGLLKWDSFNSCFRLDRKGSEKLNNQLKEERETELRLSKLAEESLEEF